MASKRVSAAGIIFANMHDSTITDLTKIRTTGSVPFGGRYRLIDFPLSNMVNSGISSVGVITKSNYQSLLDHLGSGDEWDLSRKTGGLFLLPPYGRAADSYAAGGLYRGRLEALANVIRFIERVSDDYVVMCDCDVVANVDFKKILKAHIQKGADITAVYGRGSYTHDTLKTKTVLNVNQDGLVYDVLIRPRFEKLNKLGGGEASGDEHSCVEANVSLNMFVMSKEFLLNMVKESASRNLYNFEIDVIQHRCKELKIIGYQYDGVYSQIDSIMSYHKANMALMDFAKRADVFNSERPIYTKIRDEAPAKYGLEACVTNSLIADGCIIEGSVENCVLFRGVKVGKHAVVRNSIIMQDAEIGEKCEMNYVIADKDVTLGSYRTLEGTENYPVFVDKGAKV
ncbi:MAG: glucose-1-phosphate adenylyltransferase subunit GlgD [Oscillospiraceae bacterium]|nr:glucose-1-phosphate adenylyltransferase subunit GlgD [Oscillospiraceae bacterium]